MHAQTVLALLLLGLVPQAYATTCNPVGEADDQVRCNVGELELAAACTQVKLTLENTGKLAANVMVHNRVLTRTTDFDPVAPADMAAGLADNFLNAADARVIAHIKAIGGGETAPVTFSVAKLKKGGDYRSFRSPGTAR